MAQVGYSPEKYIDSPVIYGDRVETSNPYHLGYIDSSEIICGIKD